MKKTRLRLLGVLLCTLCMHFSLFAQKSVYIPGDFNNSWADDYCNKNGKNGTIKSIDDMTDTSERWCKTRSYQTDNVCCFWEAGFGTDPTKLVDPSNTSSTFNLLPVLQICEKIIAHHVDSLQATWQDGANLKKYKILFMLDYTTNWVATGAGYDNTIGAMWVNPAAVGINSQAIYPYYTLSHEMFHAISYQCGADKPSSDYRSCNDANNGPFWERSANHAAADMYPNVNQDLARYMYATQTHYLHTRKHYTTSFLLLNMEEEFGKLVLGNIWKYNKSEHVLNTACRLFFNDDMAKMNDFVAQTAMKNITFDYAEGSTGYYYKSAVAGMNNNTDGTYINAYDIIMKKHRTIPFAVNYDKRHFAIRDCQAPQDFGYNAIQVFPENLNADGSATIKMRFRGHTGGDAYKKAGWRWGFMAVENDGSARYGTIYSDTDRTVSFQKQAADKEIWLIVTGAPTELNNNHWYHWEAGFDKYYRYPYEMRFENAVPMGFNADYEGSKTNGAAHSNGGGWVASTASVAATAYVGPNAKVLGNATVSGNARIEDFAIVKGAASVADNAVVKENAEVFSDAKISGNAVISGEARVLSGCNIYGNAFVTDNAFLINTKMYGNAIACGSLWQRDYDSYELGGTCVAGGDDEAAGFIASTESTSGAETTGTFLQWPENGNNSRSRHDGLGNLSVTQINNLVANWNNVKTRLSILDNSISASTESSNQNYDINTEGYPADYYTTDTEMALGETADEGEFAITNNKSYLSISGKVPSGTTCIIKNEAGILVSSANIYSASSISIPSACQAGSYTVTITAGGVTYCETLKK